MATKPVIITVDDEPAVLNAVDRDLRRHYGSQYRVLKAESGAAALDALQRLQLRNDPVALFVVDQRMPQMSGVQFLEQAMAIYPDAKRALLTAYADTQAAIQAINEVKLDYYLMKPWDPPEQNLYPVLDDLLADWHANYLPEFDGIRILGHRWSPLSFMVKDFLARNQVPYMWLDVETTEEGQKLLVATGGATAKLPVVIFPNGETLMQPSNTELAAKVGLRTQASMAFYDVVIVGGGPAGLAAAVYGASEGLHTLMIEREAPGGQAATSSRIENYLGFPAGLTGADLARRAVAQASRFGAELLTPQEVVNLRREDPYRIVKLADGTEISCHALLISTGVQYRKLDLPGVDKLTGAGIYYGASLSEASIFRDEDIFIVGGANSAGQAAVYFARVARSVTLIVRGDKLENGMSYYLVEQIRATPNISVLLNSNVTAVRGEEHLEGITVTNSQSKESQDFATPALLIFIGASPRTDWVAGTLERDESGFILAGPDLTKDGKKLMNWGLRREPFWLEASVPGIFVAGDVRHRSVKRMASAVGEGSMAVQFIHQYLSTL